MAFQTISHKDLVVYQNARKCVRQVYQLTRKFPDWELYLLTSQILRSSRSVRMNIVEAWRKRRYRGSFISKLSDAETEASETKEWLEEAFDCGYTTQAETEALQTEYERLIAQLVTMMNHPEKWVLPGKK